MLSVKLLSTKSLTVFSFGLILCLTLPACNKAQDKTADGDNVQINKSDPWTKNDIIIPATLNKELKSDEKPMLIQIGFKMLYDQSHIPGSVYVGPTSRSNGIQVLQNTLKNVDRNINIVLYCGCCKWVDCPNIHPGFKAVKDMGFKNAKLLYLKNTFMIDWVNKGYPATH
jgi:thiosulfate/3-mercaptopyruvate sulfurtransferase